MDAENEQGRRQRLEHAFESANAIVDLDGVPLDAKSRDLQSRVIKGELTFNEAVRLVLKRV
jgi:hypothetical protein